MDSTGWDTRYAGTELVWTAEPNRFLTEEVVDLEPGRALDLACGEGRNAVWLAAQGWMVTGVDFSAVGLAKTGWSLLVRGHAREVTSALGEPYESLRKAPLAPWAPGSKDHWVAVETDSITGRQIVRASTTSGGGLAG